MSFKPVASWWAMVFAIVAFLVPARAEEPLAITEIRASNAVRSVQFSLFPGAQAYQIESATNFTGPFLADTNFTLTPYAVRTYFTNLVNGTNVILTNVQTFWEWRRTNATSPQGLFRVRATPGTSNDLLAVQVLNRLTYGPTPDEIDRINSIGADAYIAQQLAPWTLAEDVATSASNFPALDAKLRAPDQIIYNTNALIADFRAWHLQRAVGARRQLLEILLQFFENHFVTEYSKSRDWVSGKYDDGNVENAIATQFEYRENLLWRTALLQTNTTFYDLLKISAESPAMITFLDTVSSRGDGTRIANENFARELLELFTMGVDNGYDQTDITTMSRCWTGWTLELFAPSNVFNPFATKTTQQISVLNTNYAADDYRNLEGVWALWYRTAWHNSSPKTLFTNRFVPARFGEPWTTKTYGTNTVPGKYQLLVPGRGGNAGMQEGYEVIQHLANLPFTQEYISVKLCRLFVHDDFPNPSVDPSRPEYEFYNYAAGNLSPEAALVKACMLTWETNSPQGQIWKVLETIFNSDLFRSQNAAFQKVKTPLEFTVSAIRALRASTNSTFQAGSFTAFTDGYALSSPLQRMGNMLLFDRDAPNGYPEAGPFWISAGTLAERVRWVQSLCLANGRSGHTGSQSGTGNDAQNSMSNPVGFIFAKLPPASRTNAAAVVDYFLGILYPGHGAGNLAFARQTAINFLNDGSADTDITPDYRKTAFAGIPVTNDPTQPYDERVRGMVGLLMGLPRFQEQ